MIRNPLPQLSSVTIPLGTWLAMFAIQSCEADTVDFNKDIRPILSQNCFQCHGPDETKRKGGSKETGRLRLDTEDGSRMDLGGYAALVPGKVDESELFYLITADDDQDLMPPPKHGDSLKPDQIALIKRWIEEGGNYDQHWAYKKPTRPPVPKTASEDFTLRNPIDHFVARILVTNNLTQSPEADKNALARRVALDLTGLPPTPEETEAFISDSTSGAYQRYVQLQLNKPAFGEHWARMWLDLARYADSAGYADDPLRTIWGFRDYVISSFNENKPFDQFTIEQIAGDLLPNPTTEQLVATAFHRNTKTNSEGGTSDEEFRNEAVVDRVNTTMSVWMGTTMACAQCHTHKYDPITQEEYFKVFAIFNSTADEDRKDEKPLVSLFSEEQKAEKAALKTTIASLESELLSKLSQPNQQKRKLNWERAILSGAGWQALKPLPGDMTAISKTPFTLESDNAISVTDNTRPQDTYTIAAELLADTNLVTGIKLEVFPANSRDNTSSTESEDWVLNGFEARILPADIKPNTEAKELKKIPKLKFSSSNASFEQEWYNLSDVYTGSNSDRFSGWAVQGNLNTKNEAVFELENPIELALGEKLQFKLIHNFPNKKIKRFRISVSDDRKPIPALSKKLAPTMAKRPRKRTQAEKESLLEFFAQFDPEPNEIHARIAKAETTLATIKPLTTVPVMAELTGNRARKTHLQYRGSFMDKGPEVTAGLPSEIHPYSKSSKPDRLSLAKWLVDDDNPLTARVVVNRFWQALFGIGIVTTGEDFGSQGDLPSHPELLDWLSIEFMENDWNVKHLLELIVTSATYRQSSKVDSESYQRDPDNRLFARGPRFRISAETVRDQALAVSGLLSEKLYGPSVKPPQPELGLKAAFGSATDWTTSEGSDKYRRGIYTSWRRSNPYPSMSVFDAPSRDVCIVRRERTNTPLQALVTLNDPVYIEASQALGRVLQSTEGTLNDKIAQGLRQCLVRPASEKEIATLANLYNATQSRFANAPESALQMATNPIGPLPDGADTSEFAAWTVVANALLNLDEMFLKR